MTTTKHTLKQVIGRILIKFMPERAAQIRNQSFSMSVGERNIIDTLLRAGVAHQLDKENQHDEMSRYHQQFWAGEQGAAYHRGVREIVIDVLGNHFEFLVPDVNALIAEQPNLTTLCEIGCGGGTLLTQLSKQLNGVDRFVGVDLSPAIIEENKRLYPEIEWAVGEGLQWVRENGPSNTIYLSFRGVLEYFTEQNLDALFTEVAQNKPGSVFVLVEPLGLDFDFERDMQSRTYGTEYSFSHNYRHLLERNNYDVRTFEVVRLDDHQLCAAIAVPMREPVTG